MPNYTSKEFFSRIYKKNALQAFCTLPALTAVVAAFFGYSPAVAQVAAPPAAAPEKPALGTDWVRIENDEAGKPRAMQTAIVRYTGKNAAQRPVFVDLVGAVHVGDASYYDTLNQRFTQYDALLYELVAPPGTVVRPGDRAADRGPLGMLQGGMKTMLELEHQLEKVDYTKANFVHADMSPQEFFNTMEKRDEGVLDMFFRMIGQSAAFQSKASAKGTLSEFDLLAALFAEDRARQLKLVMGAQMAEMEAMLSGFGGEQGSTIITERNKTALGVLKQQLAAGKQKLGIFYGAGHLEDMHERLINEFGLTPTQIEWVDAWDLTR